MFKRQNSGPRTGFTVLTVIVLIIGMLMVPLTFLVGRAYAQDIQDYTYLTHDAHATIVGPEGDFTWVSTGKYVNGPYEITTDNGKDHASAVHLSLGGSSKPETVVYTDLGPATWLSHSELAVGTSKFFDNKIDEDQTFKLESPVNDGGCNAKSQIHLEEQIGRGGTAISASGTARIQYWSVLGKASTNCVERVYQLNLVDSKYNNFTFYGTYFVWADASTILTSDKSSAYFVDPDYTKGHDFIAKEGRAASKSCSSSINATKGAEFGFLTIRNDEFKQGWPDGPDKIPPEQLRDLGNDLSPDPENPGCSKSNPILVTIANPGKADLEACSAGFCKGSTDTGGGSTGPDHPTCDASGLSLSWIICPIVNWAADAADGIFTKLIQPLLKTGSVDVNSGHTSGIYEVWSNFRLYGNILLIIALLALVFGQAIGGGIVDSYTAKKIAPRLIIAAILINLSIYIVALAVDITNIIGGGLNNLLTAPISGAGHYKFTVNGAAGDFGFLSLLGAGFLLFATPLGGTIIMFLIMAVAVPGALAMLGVILTLLLRRAIIILLVIVSPVAFALWCLPNTEQFFRRWWDLLFKTLMVYPIVMAIFGVSNLLAVAISDPNKNGGPGAFLGQLLAMIVILMPLFLVPFAFKMAGGVVGQIYGATGRLTNGIKNSSRKGGQRRLATGWQREGAPRITGARADFQRRLQNAASGRIQVDPVTGAETITRRNRLARGVFGAGARIVGGYNVQAAASAQQAAAAKEINDQIATGRDEEIRGLTVDKDTAEQRVQNGVRQFRSLGGAWVDEAAVDAGHRRWGGNHYAQQAALSYEMRKASTEEELQNLAHNYNHVARSWGMSDTQAGGAWIGAAFENQNQHLEYKYTDWENGGMDLDQSRRFISEAYEKKGSYALAQMSSNTIAQLMEADTRVADAGDVNAHQQAAAVAETFVSRYGGGRGIGHDEAGEPIPVATVGPIGPLGGGAPQSVVQTNTPGAGHTAQRVRQFAVQTGVYNANQNPATDDRPVVPNPPIDRES